MLFWYPKDYYGSSSHASPLVALFLAMFIQMWLVFLQKKRKRINRTRNSSRRGTTDCVRGRSIRGFIEYFWWKWTRDLDHHKSKSSSEYFTEENGTLYFLQTLMTLKVTLDCNFLQGKNHFYPIVYLCSFVPSVVSNLVDFKWSAQM